METSIDISKKILYNICIERGNDIMKPAIALFNDLCDHEVRIQSNLDYLQDAKQEAFAELGEALKGKDKRQQERHWQREPRSTERLGYMMTSP